MSFRELRNFAEMMRALGYPRLISVENFRTPNFQLVAHCLDFLVHRYDPHINVTDEIDTEDDRVEFINSVCNAMRLKAALKLNAKRLYAADGRAVRELSKVARLLYEAQRQGQGDEDESGADALDDMDVAPALGAKAGELKSVRALASEITDRGAKLFDLLGEERDLRAARQAAMSFLEQVSSTTSSTKEHTMLERQLNKLLQRARDDIQGLEETAKAQQDDERELDTKIKKKTQELERSENRLQSLKSVRPAFMDEYERIEAQLEQLYAVYLERFRNLDYLEHELATVRASEQAKVKRDERQLRRMQKRLREEDLAAMRGEADAGLGGRPFGGGGFGARPDGAGGGRIGGRVQGAIQGASDSPTGSSEDDSLSRSSEFSDSDSGSGSGRVSLGSGKGSDADSLNDSGDSLDDDSDPDDSLDGSDDDGASGDDFNGDFGDGMDSDNDF